MRGLAVVAPAHRGSTNLAARQCIRCKQDLWMLAFAGMTEGKSGVKVRLPHHFIGQAMYKARSR
jgi:hypothetical protein